MCLGTAAISAPPQYDSVNTLMSAGANGRRELASVREPLRCVEVRSSTVEKKPSVVLITVVGAANAITGMKMSANGANICILVLVACLSFTLARRLEGAADLEASDRKCPAGLRPFTQHLRKIGHQTGNGVGSGPRTGPCGRPVLFWDRFVPKTTD